MTTAMTGDGGRRGFPWRIAGWGGAAAMLLAPLVAMRFTDEVRWDGADFAAWGLMLLAAGGALELAARATRGRAARIVAGVVVAAAFLLVWAELAVGLLD